MNVIRLVMLWCGGVVIGSIFLLLLLWQPWYCSPYNITIDTSVQLLGSIGQILFAFLTAIVATAWGTMDSFKRKMSYHLTQMESRGVKSIDIVDDQALAKRVESVCNKAKEILNFNGSLKRLRESSFFSKLPDISLIGEQEAVSSSVSFYRGLQGWLQLQQSIIYDEDQMDLQKSEVICGEVMDAYLAIWHRNEQIKLQKYERGTSWISHSAIGFAIVEFVLVLFFLIDPLLAHTHAVLFGLAPPTEIPSGVIGLYVVSIFIIGVVSALALVWHFVQIYLLPRDPGF